MVCVISYDRNTNIKYTTRPYFKCKQVFSTVQFGDCVILYCML